MYGQSEIPIPNEKVNINSTTKAWKICKLKTKSVSFFLNSAPQLGRSVQILFIWRPKKEIKWQKIKTKKIIYKKKHLVKIKKTLEEKKTNLYNFFLYYFNIINTTTTTAKWIDSISILIHYLEVLRYQMVCLMQLIKTC